jgi:SsrA-binding protein
MSQIKKGPGWKPGFHESIMSGVKVIALNRKARYDYAVEDTYECGIELLGTEVKSFRNGKISFPDAWAEVSGGEVWLRSLRIAENPFSSIFNHDPDRKKKLLLHRDEIKRLTRKTEEKGYTLIPLSFYFKNGRVKVELGLCKGKKTYDKRADIRERDIKREISREFRGKLS